MKFYRVLLKYANIQPMIDGDSGTFCGIAFFSDMIKMKHLKKCLNFPENMLEDVIFQLHRWDGSGYLPELLNFQKWVNHEFMRMWAANDCMRTIAQLLGKDPWSKDVKPVYLKLIDHDTFPDICEKLSGSKRIVHSIIKYMTLVYLHVWECDWENADDFDFY